MYRLPQNLILEKHFHCCIFHLKPTQFSKNNALIINKFSGKIYSFLNFLEQNQIIPPASKDQKPKPNAFMNQVFTSKRRTSKNSFRTKILKFSQRRIER